MHHDGTSLNHVYRPPVRIRHQVRHRLFTVARVERISPACAGSCRPAPNSQAARMEIGDDIRDWIKEIKAGSASRCKDLDDQQAELKTQLADCDAATKALNASIAKNEKDVADM